MFLVFAHLFVLNGTPSGVIVGDLLLVGQPHVRGKQGAGVQSPFPDRQFNLG